MKFFLSLSLKAKIIITACSIAVTAAAAGIIIHFNSEESYRVVKVFELNGKAAVTRENTGDIDAYVGMNLENGDILSVDESSTLRISLDSDKYILLDGGTVLELIASGTEADSRTVINLQHGTILNEIKNPLSANSSYEVNTPKATMAVRGTVFTVTTVENPDGSYTTDVHVSKGSVSVQLYDENGDPKREKIVIREGGAVTVLTEVNSTSGNPAAVDGDPHFVFRSDNGELYNCGDSDPVYYPGDGDNMEYQTEQISTSALNDTEKTETSRTDETSVTDNDEEMTVTSVPDAYEANIFISDIPAVTKPPSESCGTKPVTPSEMSSFTEPPINDDVTESGISVHTGKPENTAKITTGVSGSVKRITETYRTDKAVSERITDIPKAETTARQIYSEEYQPVYTNQPAPIQGHTTAYPAQTTYRPAVTTVTEETTYKPEETTVPEEVTGEPEITTAPEEVTTGPEETTAAEDITTEPEETKSETETTPELPAVHTVNFRDENGNIISVSDMNDNEALGTLPTIPDKKGYTGEWVSCGAAVTESTVITADTDITVKYSPRTVRISIVAPLYNHATSVYGQVLECTVPYDARFADNSEGYTIQGLTDYVESLYSPENRTDFSGNVYGLSKIMFSNALSGAYVSDDSVIAGDNVYEQDGELQIVVMFCYEPI